MKTCSRCQIEKYTEEFPIKKRDGLPNSWCRDCNSETTKLYRRTPIGLITYIYNHQKTSSKRRGMIMPTYSKKSLIEWVTQQDNFKTLFLTWVSSNYTKELVPSVDRLDDKKPYSFSNIQLITWGDNNHKGNTRTSCGDSPKHTVKVNQLSLAGKFIQSFPSTITAAESVNCSRGEITRVCQGKRKTCRGFKWSYA